MNLLLIALAAMVGAIQTRTPPGAFISTASRRVITKSSQVEDGAWYDAEFMKGIESRGTPVHVAEGLTQTARIEVIR